MKIKQITFGMEINLWYYDIKIGKEWVVPMITVKNLSKNYGAKKAVADLNFTIGEGEIVGFLGQNGAGKSTTMNLLTGYLSATSGSIEIDGQSLLESPKEVKKKIGYLPEIPPLYMDLTVREYLHFIYELKGAKQPRREHIREICELTGIAAIEKRLIGNLSKGYRQRIGIAYALIGDPPILILDEPTAGLDPKQMTEIRKMIHKMGQKHTIMLSTHILSEVQAVCQRIIVLHHGRIAADGTVETLAQEMAGHCGVTVRVEGPEQKVIAVLRTIDGVKKVHSLGCIEAGIYEYSVMVQPTAVFYRTLFYRLAEQKWPLMGLKNAAGTLEELFLQLTAGETH